jgi:XTP/dITP diphosphohydrolase
VSAYPRKLVIASGNQSKAREMAELLEPTGLEILTLADFPDYGPEADETGATYAANAATKARHAVERTGLVCISDDAGFEVDALDGAPGLHSRRFLGEETPFSAKMDRILELLHHVEENRRGCRFRCAVAIATPDGRLHECEGVCEGRVARDKRGAFGFGYDPIFLLPKLGKHMAELPPAEKHRISHRGIAMEKARRMLAVLRWESGSAPSLPGEN